MDKLLIILIFAFLITGYKPNDAAVASITPIPSCAFKEALCGYVDENGQIIIAPQYDWAGKFVQERAKVRYEGLFGFIDTTGSIIVPLEYDDVSDFSNGFAQVRNNKRTSLIDLEGREVVPPNYDLLIPLDKKYILAGNKKPSPRMMRFNIRRSFPGRMHWSVLNIEDNTSSPSILSDITLTSSELGAPYWQKIRKQYFLMSSSGERLTDGFDFKMKLRNGLTQVSKDSKVAVIDSSGRFVEPFKEKGIYNFRADKWAVFKEDAKYGYLDKNHKVQIPAKFDKAYPFGENNRADVLLDENRLQIDRSGKVVAGQYGCKDIFKKQKQGELYRVVNENDEPLNDELYIRIEIKCRDLIKVSKSKREVGVINKEGLLVGGRYFHNIEAYTDELIVFRTEKGYAGVVGLTGEVLLEPINVHGHFRAIDGELVYFVGQARTVIDRDMLLELAQDPSLLVQNHTGCSKERMCFRKIESGITEFIDPFGNVFITGKYDEVSGFKDGLAWVALPERKEWCQIDKRGKIFEPSCQCGQPVIVVEIWSKYFFKDGPCYENGLETVRELRAH